MSCRKIASKRFYTTLVFYNSLDNLIGRNTEKNKQKITFFLFGARAEWVAMRFFAFLWGELPAQQWHTIYTNNGFIWKFSVQIIHGKHTKVKKPNKTKSPMHVNARRTYFTAKPRFTIKIKYFPPVEELERIPYTESGMGNNIVRKQNLVVKISFLR